MPQSYVYTEIEATVTAQSERADYGVPGSPVWDEIKPSSMELDSLYMFGKEWTNAELLAKFGEQGYDALVQMIFDAAEEWEMDE